MGKPYSRIFPEPKLFLNDVTFVEDIPKPHWMIATNYITVSRLGE
jgi:hypothetical protein